MTDHAKKARDDGNNLAKSNETLRFQNDLVLIGKTSLVSRRDAMIYTRGVLFGHVHEKDIYSKLLNLLAIISLLESLDIIKGRVS